MNATGPPSRARGPAVRARAEAVPGLRPPLLQPTALAPRAAAMRTAASRNGPAPGRAARPGGSLRSARRNRTVMALLRGCPAMTQG